MNTNVKKLLLIFGGGFLLYWAFKKIKPIDVKKKSTSTSSDTSANASGDEMEKKKNARIVLKAFMEAKKAGESKDFLEDMNREFQKEYGLKVMPNKTTGKPFVADLEGNKVL